MTAQSVEARGSRTRNRIFAVSAAGIVLAAGISIPSLAAWTDQEWITGGVGNDAGVTSSTFNVQQRTAGDLGVWGDYPTSPGNVVDFSSLAAALTPGDTVYGYVELRTVAGSLGGELTLAADTVVTGSPLAAALSYGARVVPTAGDCTASGFAAGTVLQASGSALDASSGGTISLVADGASTAGSEKVVCFALDFPSSYAGATALQGITASPIWHFDAVSVAP